MRWLQILALIVLSLVCGGYGRTAEREAPEAFVKRSFDMIQRNGLASVVDFMHPAELDRTKAMMAPLFEKGASPASNGMTQAIFGTSYSPEEFKALSSKSFLRALLSKVEGLGKTSVENAQILGSVREGDLVHVVMRSTARIEDVRLTKVQVVTLRPLGDSWGMTMTGELEGFGQMMQKMSKSMQEADSTDDENSGDGDAADAGQPEE